MRILFIHTHLRIFHFSVLGINHKKKKGEEVPQNDLQLKKQKCADILQMPVISMDNSSLKNSQRANEGDEESFKNGHWAYHDKKNSASRCKLPTCKYLTHVFCEKCEKHLCFTRERNCFVAYHKKN